VSSEDIHHAIKHALVAVDMNPDADPPSILLIGPNRAGNPIEIIILELAEGRYLAIHAMKLRTAFFGLLEEEGNG
jgi:hypothetical protein